MLQISIYVEIGKISLTFVTESFSWNFVPQHKFRYHCSITAHILHHSSYAWKRKIFSQSFWTAE
jgi:hypothetical protein